MLLRSSLAQQLPPLEPAMERIAEEATREDGERADLIQRRANSCACGHGRWDDVGKIPSCEGSATDDAQDGFGSRVRTARIVHRELSLC
jgi:hypothetical protein